MTKALHGADCNPAQDARIKYMASRACNADVESLVTFLVVCNAFDLPPSGQFVLYNNRFVLSPQSLKPVEQ